MDIRLNEKFSVSSSQSKDCDELLYPAGGCCPLLSQCLGAVTTPFGSCFLGWSLLRCRTWGMQIAPTTHSKTIHFEAVKKKRAKKTARGGFGAVGGG